MEERERRKKNIMIRGIRTIGKGIKKVGKRVLKKYLNIDVYIKRIRAIGEGLLVELEVMGNKIEIMRRKGKLRRVSLVLEDDLTEREKQIQEWLESIVREEGEKGLEARLGYGKIKVEGEWYVWNEKLGRLEEMGFGGERK